jgi:hypothetical protein
MQEKTIDTNPDITYKHMNPLNLEERIL